MHPTMGALMKAQFLLQGAQPEIKQISPLFELKTFVSTQARRQIVNTMLSTIKEYSHCSISNQLCIMILDCIKSQVDVIDLVTMQKFVIAEFKARHLFLYNQHR